MRFANVSIDLDSIACYHAIHRIDAAPDPVAIHTVALPRFLDVFDEVGCKATLFVVAADTRHGEVAAVLRDAAARGHELASHSLHHPYDLRRWSAAAILAEIEQANELIASTTGVRPVGFRTPGYNVDDRILDALTTLGFAYDSSVFSSPAYYAAKGAVMGAMALFGRPSGSDMTHPAALRAPLDPYRPRRADFSRAGRGEDALPLWEFPIGVTPVGRLPVIGTTVCALPPAGATALCRWYRRGRAALQLELHGIDLLDDRDDAVTPALALRQRDTRRPWRSKREALVAFLREMQTEHTMLTLAAAARALDAAELPSPATP